MHFFRNIENGHLGKTCLNFYIFNGLDKHRLSQVFTTVARNSSYRVKSYDEIPGPKPLPILGNIWRHFVGELSSKDVVKVHEVLNRKYGDICAFKNQMGLPDIVFIYHPDEIEKMIRNEGSWPVRNGFDSLVHYRNTLRSNVFGESTGLANSQGEEWYKLRSKVNPIFMQPRAVRRYIPGLDEVSSDFVERMKSFAAANAKSEMPPTFHDELCKWAFETICTVGLDRRMGALDEVPNKQAKTMVEYIVELTRLLGILDFTPIGPYCIKYNLPVWRKFVKYQDFFTDVILKIMNESSVDMRNDDQQNEESVFQILLKIDKKVAVLMTLDMLSAGVDTTGKFASAILYHISKNVEVQNKLRDEVMEHIPSKSTPITNEILLNLKYLRAVVKEAGRVSPISSTHVRTTTSDLVLSGYQIPKGTTILIPTLYLSNNNNHYPRPNEFIPERWLRTTNGSLSSKNVNTFVTLPFGYGPRSCIGRRFANLEVEILIAKVIRNFELGWRYSDMRFGEDMFYGIKDPLRIHIREYDN